VVLDVFKGHLPQKVKTLKLHTDLLTIPGIMTSDLQVLMCN